MKIIMTSVDADKLREALAGMQELLKTMRSIRCRDQEKEDFTWIEAVADGILGELVPDEIYRIVLEYKPEFNKVHISKEKDYDRNEKELFPWDAEEGSGGKARREMKLMYEPGDNLGWIRREPFERVLRLMIAWARAYHFARAEMAGKETFEEAEVTIEALACTLLPKKKCRVVMDYDPAGEKVYFDVVDEPEAVSEQEDGSPK